MSTKNVRNLLLLVNALAIIALFAGPLNVVMNTPKKYHGSGDYVWFGAIVTSCVIMVLSYALARRERWARSALALALTIFGAFTLGKLLELMPGDFNPAFLVFERVRGLLLLALALTVFASDGIDDLVSGFVDDEEDDKRKARNRGTAGSTVRTMLPQPGPSKSRWMVAATILAGLWFFGSAYGFLFDLWSFIKEGQPLGLSVLPPAVDASLSTLAVLTSGLSAWAFAMSPSRLRYACLVAPPLNILSLLTNYFLAVGGVSINLVLLVLAVCNWRKLRGDSDKQSVRPASAS